MSKIEGYGVYQNSYYEKSAQSRQVKEAAEADKADKTEKNSQASLSFKAKRLLQQLKNTYGNMDFMVADYESEEEAATYLSRGTKEYSVLIEPDVLEEMAADDKAKDKYLGMLNDATDKLAYLKNQLGDKKDEVTHMGVSIGKDGEISYFAELEKVNEKQRERIEKAREDKKEDKAKQDSVKRTKVQADSVEELLKKIKSVDWNKIKSEDAKESGSRIDYSV